MTDLFEKLGKIMVLTSQSSVQGLSEEKMYELQKARIELACFFLSDMDNDVLCKYEIQELTIKAKEKGNFTEDHIPFHEAFMYLVQRLNYLESALSEISFEDYNADNTKTIDVATGSIYVRETCDIEYVAEYNINNSTSIQDRQRIAALLTEYNNGSISRSTYERSIMEYVESGHLEKVDRDYDIDAWGESTGMMYDDDDIDVEELDVKVNSKGEILEDE